MDLVVAINDFVTLFDTKVISFLPYVHTRNWTVHRLMWAIRGTLQTIIYRPKSHNLPTHPIFSLLQWPPRHANLGHQCGHRTTPVQIASLQRYFGNNKAFQTDYLLGWPLLKKVSQYGSVAKSTVWKRVDWETWSLGWCVVCLGIGSYHTHTQSLRQNVNHCKVCCMSFPYILANVGWVDWGGGGGGWAEPVVLLILLSPHSNLLSTKTRELVVVNGMYGQLLYTLFNG